MFSEDSIVGEITDPQGSLRIGNVGDTECVYFSYSGSQSGRHFHLVYTGRELSSLIATAKKAVALAPSLKARATIRLGCQPPKPIRLQVVLVSPENRPAAIILRFSGKDWKQDVVGSPENLLDLLSRAERRAPMPGVVGTLDRFGTTIWMIEGQTLEVSDELSHGTGYYREYLHHSEVPESTVVRAWATQINSKMIVVAFEYAQSWEPTGSVDLQQGQQGDQSLQDGLIRQSRETHALLSKTMFDSGQVDPIWSGKVTLASLIGDILMSDEKTGLATWSGEGGNPILKAGIQTLKEGKLSPHDNALFHLVSGYFGIAQEPAQAVAQVNRHMTSAWTYARFNAPEMVRLVLADWHFLLTKVLRGATSGPQFAAWNEARTSYQGEVTPTVFCLPAPFPWVKTWTPALTSAPQPKVQAPPPERPPVEDIKLPPIPDRPRPTVFDAPTREEAAPGLLAGHGRAPVAGPARPSAASSIPEIEFEDEDTDDSNSGQATPWSDELMAIEDKKPRVGSKRSLVPLAVVSLVLVSIPVAYTLYQKFAPNTPAQAPTSTPTPVVSITPDLKPTPTPAQVTASPTPQVPLAGPLPEGELSINGFKPDGKLKEQDIFEAGYAPIDRFPEDDKGVARYQSPEKGTVIVNFSLPSRVVTSIQGDRLFIKEQLVADLSSNPDVFKDDKRFSKFKLQATIDDEGKVRAYTLSQDGLYLPEPLVDSPKRALEFHRKIRNPKFFETLSADVANMRLTNGETILFQYLGGFDIDRLKYLIEQGADPNAKCWADGGTALHHCKDVKVAELLLKLGANPNITDDQARTPHDVAETPELKAVLNPERKAPSDNKTPTPAPTTSPTPTPTPANQG